MKNIIYNPNTHTFKFLQDLSRSTGGSLVFVDSDVVSNKSLIKAIRKEFPDLRIRVLDYKTMPVDFNRKDYTEAFFSSIGETVCYVHIDEEFEFLKTQKILKNTHVTTWAVDHVEFVQFKDEYLETFAQNIAANEARSTVTTKAAVIIQNQYSDSASDALVICHQMKANVSIVGVLLQKFK